MSGEKSTYTWIFCLLFSKQFFFLVPELRVTLVQIKGRENIDEILENVSAFVGNAVKNNGPRVVCLPECFNGPYIERCFRDFAEVIPTGPSCQKLSSLAKEFDIYLIGGIIERDSDDPSVMYNTCTVFGPDGTLVARHRKTHLCDLRLDGCVVNEVDYLKPGNGITVFELDGIKCGIAICFDADFSSFIHLYKQAGIC